jgi:hypothetical protein
MLIRRMRPVHVALLVALLSSAFAGGTSADQCVDADAVGSAINQLRVALTELNPAGDITLAAKFEAVFNIEAAIRTLGRSP